MEEHTRGGNYIPKVINQKKKRRKRGRVIRKGGKNTNRSFLFGLPVLPEKKKRKKGGGWTIRDRNGVKNGGRTQGENSSVSFLAKSIKRERGAHDAIHACSKRKKETHLFRHRKGKRKTHKHGSLAVISSTRGKEKEKRKSDGAPGNRAVVVQRRPYSPGGGEGGEEWWHRNFVPQGGGGEKMRAESLLSRKGKKRKKREGEHTVSRHFPSLGQ